MNWAERGISPVKASLIGLVLLAVATYFVFTKQLPFTHHFTVNAVVRNSNLLVPGSAVRIGGVDVGKVSSTGRYRDTNLSVVRMEIDNTSQEIHSDATIAIRPRLFLEGNFYVQLSPGSAGAPPIKDGGTIPVGRTSTPVQLDQVLDALPASIRLGLQQTLQGFGQSLNTTPTPEQNQHLNPYVRGLTGAQGVNKSFDTSVAALRDSAQVSEALTGPHGKALSQTIAGFARASAGLARADGRLTQLVSDFDTTMRAAATQQQGLRRTVALLGPTTRNANIAFSALDRAFPATEQFSTALAGSLSQLPSTITTAYPWLSQAGPLLSNSELRGLLNDLQPATAYLAQLTHSELQFLPKITKFNRCITKVFLPTGNLVVNDGPLSSGAPNYREFWYAMTGQAAEGQGADGNGNFLRIGASGGPVTVESGKTNFEGQNDTGFGQLPAAPLSTRPAFPNKVPPLKRSVACYTQPIPNVNGAASVGPADGSHPNASPPPVPHDPSENAP
jgi:phospholipid/cholesterol/gamma-HCH transport system substrate-binding protein